MEKMWRLHLKNLSKKQEEYLQEKLLLDLLKSIFDDFEEGLTDRLIAKLTKNMLVKLKITK